MSECGLNGPPLHWSRADIGEFLQEGAEKTIHSWRTLGITAGGARY